jgi:hypothetical protein
VWPGQFGASEICPPPPLVDCKHLAGVFDSDPFSYCLESKKTLLLYIDTATALGMDSAARPGVGEEEQMFLPHEELAEQDEYHWTEGQQELINPLDLLPVYSNVHR